MSNYKDLYKLIDGLKTKIKNLDISKSKSKSKSNLVSYRIFCPNKINSNKKYIGLLFDNNFNEFESDESKEIKKFSSFIKLQKSNMIINYNIQIELTSTPLINTLCSIGLGIKTKSDSKIKIIKGSKYTFDLALNQNIINNKIQITNTVLYTSSFGEELCMFGEFNSDITINYKKSLIKILFI